MKDTKHVGDYTFPCALCEETISIPIHVGFRYRDGKAFLCSDPDMSAIWMHLWTAHEEYADAESDY